MQLKTASLPPLGTNVYLLLNEDLRQAVVFDAPLGTCDFLDQVLSDGSFQVQAALLTHGHWDHMLDAAALNQRQIPLWMHAADRMLVEDPGLMADFLIPGLGVEPAQVDRTLEHGQVLSILGHEMEVRHVPGHSEGSLLFYFPSLAIAISGDAVFAGGIGRTDLPGGSFELLQSSIQQQIYTLPDPVMLYPGHGPATTVGQEKAHNPFVRPA